ncbi:MAG: hypothetical protein ACM3PY_07390 [Omnitrophica WOR_2 bacterium]
MGKLLSQKTFKFEFEITVAVDEVEEKHLQPDQPSSQLPYLKQLQQALLKDDTALVEQMTSLAVARLQEYVDYLAMQNDQVALLKIAASLEPEHRNFFQKYKNDFTALSRPIRRSSLSASEIDCSIYELEPGLEMDWQPVWRDLRGKNELGEMIADITTPLNSVPHLTNGHYLLARYLTRQKNGVHLEACCTCGEVFESNAEDECRAMEIVWDDFRIHYEKVQAIQRA